MSATLPTAPRTPNAASTPSAARSRLQELEGVIVLVGIFFAILMGAMDALVVSTVLPTIAGDLHQVNGVTFVVSGYLVSSTIAIPIFGRLSDISSRRNVFLAGLVIFIAGSMLAGLSQNLTELIIFRSVQGFGGGGIFPVAIGMVTVMFPPEQRTRAVALLTASSGIAIVAGPLLGSYIVSVTTWRWVFYINLPFGVFAAAIVALAVGPLRSSTGGRLDLPATALLAGWVSTLMIALVQVADAGWGWADPRILALLAGTIALFAAYLVRELRISDPLIPWRILGRRVIASASAISGFTGIVFSALITFLSLYVGIVLGHSAADIRDMIYFVAIPLVIGAGSAGAILNRVPYRVVVVPGLLLSGLTALALTVLTAATPLWVLSFGFLPTGGIALPLIPVGFGLGLSLAGATVAVQNEAPSQEVGAAVGLVRFFQSLGGAIGLSLLTIYQAWRFQGLSKAATTPTAVLNALVQSYNEVFLLLAISVLLAFVAAFWLTGRVKVSRPTATPTVELTSKSEPPA